ncbi:hypothetical protein Dimus_005663, partial [Dionaea muscipula]
ADEFSRLVLAIHKRHDIEIRQEASGGKTHITVMAMMMMMTMIMEVMPLLLQDQFLKHDMNSQHNMTFHQKKLRRKFDQDENLEKDLEQEARKKRKLTKREQRERMLKKKRIKSP